MLLAGGASVLSADERVMGQAAALADFMRANPAQGIVLHHVLSVCITVSGVPFALVDLAAGWVFRDRPWLVLLILLAAKTVGSLVCFCVARLWLSEDRKAEVLAHPTIARVNRLLAHSPLYYGTLARLAVMPSLIKNYGLALLDIELPTYLCCCVLGSCVGVPLQAMLGMHMGHIYLGVAAADSAEEAGSSDVAMAGGAVVGVISTILVLSSVVRTLLGSDEEEAAAAKAR